MSPLMEQRHRHLIAVVLSALEAHRDGAPGVRCPWCNDPVSVEDVPEVGSIYVSCEKGCTYSHVNTAPRRTGESGESAADAF